jgi:hypothetical protein
MNIAKQQKVIERQEAISNPYSNSLVDISKNDLIELTKIVNYESLWKDSYVMIDSRYRNLSNTDRTKNVFSILNNSKAKVDGSGIVTALGDLRDIVQIEIESFVIPRPAAIVNYYNIITMSILEWRSDSIETYENSEYHFKFTTEEFGNKIRLIPDRKEYRFNKPINLLETFTIRFGSPFAPIEFDEDRLSPSLISYDVIGTFTFSSRHNLETGDIVFITNFTSDTSTTAKNQSLLDEINRKKGHLITKIDSTTFAIQVDFTKIDTPDVNNNPNIYFGSKRILLPIRFRYLLHASEHEE